MSDVHGDGGSFELPKQTTIYDVAKAAGVSPSTVSRTFSRPGRVSNRTAAHIRKVAAELGYRTDRVHQQAAPTHTHMIGLAVTDVTNPFFFSLLRGAEQVCTQHGYALMLFDAQESGPREREIFERALPVLDGVVIASSRLSDTALRGFAKKVPTVVLNRVVAGLPCVVSDYERGVRRALEHLAGLGHRRVAYIAGPPASWADGARWRAFHEAASDLGMVDCRLGPVMPTVRGGEQVLPQIHEHKVSAVIAYNDLIAIGILRGTAAAGVRVPDRLSVIGFDNIFASDLVTPRLTSIASPLGLVGEKAARSVISLIEHHDEQADFMEPLVMPMRLIERASTGPARA
ncbi:MAG: LacI family DNA-binding transcriptional regulator [Propionibacterium acidifaciens]